MASIRGILNIQSLNELTSENKCAGRSAVPGGRARLARASRSLPDAISVLRAGETESAQRPERRRARPGRGAERCWCRPERRVRVLTECPGPGAPMRGGTRRSCASTCAPGAATAAERSDPARRGGAGAPVGAAGTPVVPVPPVARG